MDIRIRGGIAAGALGAGLVLLLLLQFPGEQHAAPQSAPKAPPVSLPPIVTAPKPEPEPKAPRRTVAAIPAANSSSETPPPEPRAAPAEPEPQLAAAEASAPPPPQAAAKAEKPDSVFSWGPWAGQPQSPGGSSGTPAGGEKNSGVLPGVSVAASSGNSNGVNSTGSTGGGGGGGPVTQPPVVTPPPSTTPTNTRPGFGFGDRNHAHTKGR